jgi:excisionase family DNA binding protein
MKEDTEKPLFIRPAEAARLLNISRSKAYDLVHSGDLHARRVGGSIRILRSQIEEMARDTGKLSD